MSDLDATDQQAPEGKDTPPENGGSWVDSVPEEFREAGFVTKYGSQDEFFKGMDNLTQLAGQKVQGLVPLGDDASDDDRAAHDLQLRGLLGMPEDLQGYTEGLDMHDFGEDSLMPKLAETMFAAGLKPAGMQSVLDLVNEHSAVNATARQAAYDKAFDESESVLKEKYGVDDLAPFIQMGEEVLNEVFTPEAAKLIAESGAGNHPAIVESLVGIHKALGLKGGKGPLGDPKNGGEPLTKEQLREMMQDPKYYDPDHRDDAYVKKIRAGFEALHPVQEI